MEMSAPAEAIGLAVSTEDVFRHPLPAFEFPAGKASTNSMASCYVQYFCGFQFQHWKAFCFEASRYLVGKGKMTISEKCRNTLVSRPSINPEPSGEAEVTLNFHTAVVIPVNEMLESVLTDVSENFGTMSLQRSHLGKTKLFPDFVLRPRSTPVEPERPFVVVEVKTPLINVGVALSKLQSAAERLQTSGSCPDGMRPTLFAFLQTFSYCANAETCCAFLTNYNESRFIHIDLSQKVARISGVVRYNHVWSSRAKRPHLYQAILYLVHFARDEAGRPDRNEMDELILSDPSYEGDGRDGEEAHRFPRATTRSMTRRQRSRAGSENEGASSGSKQSNTYGAATENLSFNIYQLLRRAKDVPLGYGLTGSVLESKTENDDPVVLKSARLKEEGCLGHVKNEIKMYWHHLAALQGIFVPKMIGWCEEKHVTGGSVFLVTERVGDAISRDKGELYSKVSTKGFSVNNFSLDDDNISRLTKLSLQSLRAIHSQDVLHGDIRCSNMRVALCEGKVCRVWWIDFGNSKYSKNEEAKKMEEEALLDLFDQPAIPVSPI